MPKLIAVLEANPARVEKMKVWLDDRLYMYDRSIESDLPSLLAVLRQRLSDILILCLDQVTLEKPLRRADGFSEVVLSPWAILEDCLMSSPRPFPILIHGDHSATQVIPLLSSAWKLWPIHFVTSDAGSHWVGDAWFPALRDSLEDTEPQEPLSDVLVDSNLQGG